MNSIKMHLKTQRGSAEHCSKKVIQKTEIPFLWRFREQYTKKLV